MIDSCAGRRFVRVPLDESNPPENSPNEKSPFPDYAVMDRDYDDLPKDKRRMVFCGVISSWPKEFRRGIVRKGVRGFYDCPLDITMGEHL